MKKDVFIIKTTKYISIESYLIGRIRFSDVNQEISYLDVNVSYSSLGEEIKKKLSESREIPEYVLMHYWNNREIVENFTQQEEQKIMERYLYKSRNAIYKDALFLSVSILNNDLFVEPYHQDRIYSYTAAKNKDGRGIDFKYPVDITAEELGKAVLEGFEYCTSIYKKKK